MKLQFLEGEYSVCQLLPNLPIPSWANDFLSISQTEDELTIISRSPGVPADVKAQHQFCCFRVVGELEFDVIGVIAGISTVLADQKIPILSISTYNTDYFLIPLSQRELAIKSLSESGYGIVE